MAARAPHGGAPPAVAVQPFHHCAHAAAEHGCGDVGLRRARIGLHGDPARLVVAARGRRAAAGREPTRRGPDELGGGPARHAPDAAAHGLFVRHSAGVANPGRHTDDAGQRAGYRGPGRAAGGAFPGQPRRPAVLRPADRFPRLGARTMRRRRNAAAAGAREDRGAEPQAQRTGERCAQRRPLLSVPSPAAVESARGRVDGLRAQARQARRPECAAARARRRRAWRVFLGDRGRHVAVARGALRHHAGHRHAAAARHRVAVRRDDGAPAEPPAPRRRARSTARGRRLRNPAAARRRQPAQHEPLALRTPRRRRSRYRPLYPCRVRCLPGPVRRRLVHRQGHLRRRCVRTCAGRSPAGEPRPQPRPAGRLLRALRPDQRRAAGRGIALALRRRREAPPPVDPRRLADHRLADAETAGSGRRGRERRDDPHARRQAEESAVGAVALEDLSTTCGAA